MPICNVCGIPTHLGPPRSVVIGQIAPTARPLGQCATISKPDAERLVQVLLGHARLPRPGSSLNLCDNQWLANMSGSYEVLSRAA